MSFTTRVFLLVSILSGFVSSLPAQSRLERPTAKSQSKQVSQHAATQDFRDAFIESSKVYKTNLEKLLVLYENDVEKLHQQTAKLKQLYESGLISRVEYESNLAKTTEAEAKVDDVRKQIAMIGLTIEASRPAGPYDWRVEIPTFSNVEWSTGNNRIDALIRENGARYGVDPYLIYCVIRQESSFSATALSVKGAQGLMQLMPATAARYGVTNVNDPAQNIRGGTRYLKDLLQLFHGRIELVLAGYNAGEGAVMKYGLTVPPYKETKDYVRLIGQRYFRKSNSPLR